MTKKMPYTIIGKPHYFVKGAILLCLLAWVSPSLAQKVGKDDYFYVLNTRQGLSDNNILQMIQLPDNRLAVKTKRGINIYDGKHFRFIPLSTKQAQRLTKYDGQTHLYADAQNRLWVKDCHLVYCIDLKRNVPLMHPLDFLKIKETDKLALGKDSISDLFVDDKRNVWIVKNATAINVKDGSHVGLKDSWGRLQDLDTDGKYVYTFHASGTVAAFKDGKLVYTAKAYSPHESLYYQATSLVVQTMSGQFYQIRTGYNVERRTGVSVFLHFDPERRTYTKIFACDYVLHTLNMSSDNQALISSQQGYLMFDFMVGNTPREVKELSLPDGKSLVTGINTVYRDREGAIWLGTYNDGLIYVSPMLGLFFTIDQPWWQSGWFIVCIVVLVLLVIGGIVYSLKKKRKRASEAENTITESEPIIEETRPIAEQSEPEFIVKARTLVEQHLRESEYGVEQLANDLCMERTGLYKKLKSLSDTTPVAFIRNIRLQRAAVLLKEGKMTVNEIAESTGFGSSSYFTKCFKNAFGVLPSEYK